MVVEDVKSHLDNIIELNKDNLDPEFFKTNLFFAGGCIRSLFNDEVPKDYDIFCRTPEALEELKVLLEGKQLFKSSNSIGLRVDGKELQFIICEVGSPEKITGEFDFLMNIGYYAPNEGNPYMNSLGFDKTLRINHKARNVLGTLARVAKFIERGYGAPSAQDLITLGIRASKMEPITKVSQLAAHCRLASCITPTIIANNELEEDIDIGSLNVILRGSGA